MFELFKKVIGTAVIATSSLVSAHLGANVGVGTVPVLDQFTGTTSPVTAITQRTYGKSVMLTGLTTGQCLTLNSNSVITTTACGSGGGSSSFGKSWEIDANNFLAPTTTLTVRFPLGFISQASSTNVGNFTITGNATATNATTSNFYVSGNTTLATLTGILKGNGASPLTVAANGTDFTLISANTCSAGNHVSAITAAGAITCSADSGGGGGTYPFTPGTFGSTNTSATSTAINDTAGFISTASSTLSLLTSVNATTSNATTTTLALSGLATAGGTYLAVDPNGVVIATTSPLNINSNATAYKQASNWAATTTLAGTPTYANGSSGVGATLTEVGFGALFVDGNSPAVGDRILVKNQTSAFQNGIYTVTATGSGIASYVLTRSTDFNNVNDIFPGVATYIIGGTANAGDTFVLVTTGTIIVGTTNLTFAEQSAGAISASNGITLTGSALSLDQTFAATWTGLEKFNAGLLSNSSTTLQNFTALQSTSTNATTTNFFSTTASSTNLFGQSINGFGLSSCTGTNALTWTGGSFSCTAQPQGTVTSIATNNGLTGGTITGSGTLGLATINAGVLGAVTNGAVPTSQATSTLYGTGITNQVLTWSGSSAVWQTAAGGSQTPYTSNHDAAGFAIFDAGGFVGTSTTATSTVAASSTASVGAVMTGNATCPFSINGNCWPYNFGTTSAQALATTTITFPAMNGQVNFYFHATSSSSGAERCIVLNNDTSASYSWQWKRIDENNGGSSAGTNVQCADIDNSPGNAGEVYIWGTVYDIPGDYKRVFFTMEDSDNQNGFGNFVYKKTAAITSISIVAGRTNSTVKWGQNTVLRATGY